MGARVSAETKKGLTLIAQGMAVSHAAKVCGLDPSTLWKALRKQGHVREIPTKEVVETPIQKT